MNFAAIALGSILAVVAILAVQVTCYKVTDFFRGRACMKRNRAIWAAQDAARAARR